jgi:hypothetical protein
MATEHLELVLSRRAGVAIPFLILAKVFDSQTVFVESITRADQLSLSVHLVLPLLDVLYVYWTKLKARYPGAEQLLPKIDFLWSKL